MPIIDLFNHHFQGALFSIADVPDKERSLAIARSNPLPGTGKECFACYGAHDSFDTWVTYGFVDQSALFVRSVAMTVDLPDLGTIRLTNFDKTRDRRALPPSVSDLHFYIPALLARRTDHIEVGRLLIPGPSAPRALRRTLHFLIAEMSPGHSRQRDLVMEAERQIIAAKPSLLSGSLGFPAAPGPAGPSAKADFEGLSSSVRIAAGPHSELPLLCQRVAGDVVGILYEKGTGRLTVIRRR